MDPTPGSKTYGFITETPKPGWRQARAPSGPGFDPCLQEDGGQSVAASISRNGPRAQANVMAAFSEFAVPKAFDTDVNAPALSEYRAMVADGYDLGSVAYRSPRGRVSDASRRRRGRRRGDFAETRRGGAAAADVDSPQRRGAAPPRLPRG